MITSVDWMSRAACRDEDPDLFIGPDGETELDRDRREREAKAVCDRCTVIASCHAFAIAHNDKWAIAAAMTPEERRAA